MNLYDVAIAKKLSGGGGGGGGSSDFTTAQVTLKNTNPSFYPYKVCMALTDYGVLTVDLFQVTDERTVTVPLYKGHYMLEGDMFQNIDFNIMPTWSGDVELSGSGFDITGDCTISLASLNQ